MGDLEADYFVVGAGAGGMAFTDAVLTHSKADVVVVDRRPSPGGHWVDAYPFVRLHQPSVFYGVDSVPLGSDLVDTHGPNAGFYEQAGAHEIRAYYERVMHRHFVPTGRVRWFPCSDWNGESGFVSRLTGETTNVRVRKKIVDTAYLEGSFPATSPPPFEVADGVRVVSPTTLTRLEKLPQRIVVVGGGKTALDTCVWLLEHGVSPSVIRWIRPREGWWLNRKFQQPLSLLPDFYWGAAAQTEALASATSIDDVFARLEAENVFFRIDRSVPATMLHGAIMTEQELAMLRRIEDVIRLGRVLRLERDAIVLAQGTVATEKDTLFVHCAVSGVQRRPARPIFEPRRLTMQPFGWGFACYQLAMIGVVEATLESDADKNGVCPAMTYWDVNRDYLTASLARVMSDQARMAHPALTAWAKTSRLNPTNAGNAYRDDPRMKDARERIKRHGMNAVANMMKLLSS